MKKIFIYLLFLFGLISFVNSIDYNNITFTNEEFYNGAITASKVIELSTGDIAVGYSKSSGGLGLKICDLDGTNCGSEAVVEGGGTYTSIDLFEDVENNRIIFTYSSTTGLRHQNYNLSGSYLSEGQWIQLASANYVSAVQVSSTDFAIAYQDTADSSKGKIISCKLDGSSCGSENTIYTGSATYIKLIKSSNEKLVMAMNLNNGNGGTYVTDLDGTNKGVQRVFNTGSTTYIDMIEGSDNKLKIVYRDNGNSNYGTFRSCDLDGTNCGSEVVYKSGVIGWQSLNEFDNKLFVQYYDGTDSEKGKSINMNLDGTSISSESTYSSTDSYYTDSIITTNNQLLISYSDPNGLNKGMFAFSEPFTTIADINFNYPTLDSYINTSTFTLNVSFTEITNSTYIFNSGTETILGTNTNESTAVLTGIEGLNNIQVFTNTSGELANNSINFTIDTIDPTLSFTNNVNFNDYTINLSNLNVLASDTNFANITINWDDLTTNTTTSTTFTGSKTFLTNGNHSFNITATDLAGNSVTESGNLFINPVFYAYFQLSNGTAVTDFTFNDIDFVNYANFSYYDLGLGAQSLTFEKLGFLTENFNFTLNSTNELNLTFNVTNSKIILNIYDRDTESLISGSTSTITLVATNGFQGTTTTGTLEIEDINFLDEQYQVIVSNPDFVTESVYFNYNNQEVLNVDVYLIDINETNLGFVTMLAVADTGQLIQGAICQALEWKPSISAFESVAQGQTDSNGETNINIELENKLYKFSCSKSGTTITTNSQIITASGTTIPITLPTSVTIAPNKFEDLTFSLRNETLNATHQRIIFTYSDNNNLVNEACLKIYKKVGLGLTTLQSSCVSASSGQIQLIQDINQTYIIQTSAEITINDVKTNLGDIFFYPETDITQLFSDYGLEIIIPLLFTLIGVSIGLLLVPQNIYISIVSTIIMVWISVLIVPTIVSTNIAIFITIICLLMLWGGAKRK